MIRCWSLLELTERSISCARVSVQQLGWGFTQWVERVTWWS